jgi:FKBP-type peptidyl-prolyl cis-trans isomerase FkpA
MTFKLARAALLGCALLLTACGQTEESVMEQIQKAEANDARTAQQNLAAAQRYLTEVAMRPGIRTTASGLLIQVVQAGPDQNLPRPPANASVLVHYQGSLPDGTVFDSSIARGEPQEFPLSEVVPGFAEGIMLMRPGDTFVLFIPPDRGYGPAGRPPSIPGNSALTFRVQLLAFRTPDGRVVSLPQPGRPG